MVVYLSYTIDDLLFVVFLLLLFSLNNLSAMALPLIITD